MKNLNSCKEAAATQKTSAVRQICNFHTYSCDRHYAATQWAEGFSMSGHQRWRLIVRLGASTTVCLFHSLNSVVLSRVD